MAYSSSNRFTETITQLKPKSGPNHDNDQFTKPLASAARDYDDARMRHHNTTRNLIYQFQTSDTMQTHRFISIATVCMLSNLVFVGCATVKIPPLAQGSGPVRVHVRGQFLQPAGKGFAGQVVTVLPVQSIQPNGVASFRETFLAGGKPGDPSTKTGPDGRFSIDATLSKGRYYAVMIGGQSGQPATPQNGPPVFSFGGEQREATVDYGVIRSVVVQTSYR